MTAAERVQAAWESVKSLPLIDFTPDEAEALLDALRSSQPDTREGFAAGIEAAAKVAEGWTSSLVPGNMERYYGHDEAARSIAAAIRALEAHRTAKETTDG